MNPDDNGPGEVQEKPGLPTGGSASPSAGSFPQIKLSEALLTDTAQADIALTMQQMQQWGQTVNQTANSHSLVMPNMQRVRLVPGTQLDEEFILQRTVTPDMRHTFLHHLLKLNLVEYKVLVPGRAPRTTQLRASDYSRLHPEVQEQILQESSSALLFVRSVYDLYQRADVYQHNPPTYSRIEIDWEKLFPEEIEIIDHTEARQPTMLEQLLKLYTMYMATGVTSPMPHFVGPPGAGKSTIFKQLADMLGVKLHVINVSRISPLEIEGVQMPVDGNTRLELLLSTHWNTANEGDIFLFDEFLRGFPEVYNGLLDIFTSREVGGHQLPKVFIAGASNSVVTYDSALEDRLLHITVPDPRNNRRVRKDLGQRLIDTLGLNPEMLETSEMDDLLAQEVLPTYAILDKFKGRGTQSGPANGNTKGSSLRKLIGQAQLRQIESSHLRELIDTNNRVSIKDRRTQYVFLYTGKGVDRTYEGKATSLKDSPDLTDLQRMNLLLNIQLIEMEKIKTGTTEKETESEPAF